MIKVYTDAIYIVTDEYNIFYTGRDIEKAEEIFDKYQDKYENIQIKALVGNKKNKTEIVKGV